MSSTRLVAGAMSGTSADGVDVALVRVDDNGAGVVPALLWHHHRPYPQPLRDAIFAVRSVGALRLADLAELGRDIALVYATAVNEAMIVAHLRAGDIACIAAHGQTLFHGPPLTLQWIDPAVLAAETGCAVVSDFRRADCAAGGQGAPLVPYADLVFFSHPKRTRVAINIGGIANLTFLPAGGGAESAIAFDTGPGNCISDWLCRTLLPDGPGYDEDGEIALGGKALPLAVQRIMRSSYFQQAPPRTTDGPAMIATFEEALGEAMQTACAEDLLATAAQLTAHALADAIRRYLPARPDELILSGGGIHNQAIRRVLAEEMPGVPILTSDELGVPSAAKEAMAFALLGLATIEGRPGNVPAATGARRPVILGSITPCP